MEETIIQDNPGFFSKIKGIFTRTELLEEDEIDEITEAQAANPAVTIRQNYRYTVTVRRQIVSFEDAMAAANGIKRGEQQILNLSSTDPVTRQKIVDFMCGVNYSQEGTWEELGDHIYMIAPPTAYIEVAPPTPRMNSIRN
jgi:cell division inhibitor SepF